MNLFSPVVTKIWKFLFFLFLTVWTYFSSDFFLKLTALRTLNSNLLQFLGYLERFRKFNKKRFRFFNSALLHTVHGFFCRKTTLRDKYWSLIGWMINCFCFLLYTADRALHCEIYRVICTRKCWSEILKVDWSFNTVWSCVSYSIICFTRISDFFRTILDLTVYILDSTDSSKT